MTAHYLERHSDPENDISRGTEVTRVMVKQSSETPVFGFRIVRIHVSIFRILGMGAIVGVAGFFEHAASVMFIEDVVDVHTQG